MAKTTVDNTKKQTQISDDDLKTMRKDGTLKGYNYLPHGKNADTTKSDEKVTTTYSAVKTKIVKTKYTNGTITKTIPEKIEVNTASENTKTVITKTNSKAKKSIDGELKNITYQNTAKGLFSSSTTPKYEKLNNVVKNTSAAAWEKAKTTKKENNERLLQEEDNNQVLAILKHEVPADIAELKAKMDMVFEILNITKVTS